nr:2Fe-2S iron-sulfur cluster-binding protein [Ideonella oryzae]
MPDGRTFSAQGDETLLDAAQRQGIVFNYSCRTGRCSSCRGRVITGSTTAQQTETGLTEADRQQGFILTCVRQALGPVQLEISDLGNISMPETRTVPCRILSLNPLAPDVLQVVLRLPPTATVDFIPGQYIDIIGPAGLRRSYSIANAPRADRSIELHIREVNGGAMSQYWFHTAKVNDLLRLRGPLGTFFVREQADKDLVFLATGTGIAPIKAILEGLSTLQAEAQPRSVSVYWGGRYERDLYWTPNQFQNVRFIPVLSRGEATWADARGHVQDILLNERPILENVHVYACGSEAMIASARSQLLKAGLTSSQFHSDAFVASSSVSA